MVVDLARISVTQGGGGSWRRLEVLNLLALWEVIVSSAYNGDATVG